SGSVVLDMLTGAAVGLHFAGLYQESNYAVRASVLREYLRGRRWEHPPEINTGGESPTPPPGSPSGTASTAAPPPTGGAPSVTVAGGAVTLSVPLTITLALGQPVQAQVQTGGVYGGAVTQPTLAQPTAAQVEAAAKQYWRQRPADVVAVRVGFDSDG